jgi:hypothetical protein
LKLEKPLSISVFKRFSFVIRITGYDFGINLFDKFLSVAPLQSPDGEMGFSHFLKVTDKQ